MSEDSPDFSKLDDYKVKVLRAAKEVQELCDDMEANGFVDFPNEIRSHQKALEFYGVTGGYFDVIQGRPSYWSR